MPFFSVIITTYNRKELLPIAIQSVLTQKFENFELIVVDDASSDGTEHIIKAITDSRIRYIKNEKNLHKGGARNVGINASSGKYVCFLDDDDYYLPNHLSVLYEHIQKAQNPIGFFYTLSYTENRYSKHRFARKHQPMGNSHPVAYVFHHKNGIPTPLVCIESSILRIMQFNPNIRIGQDTELFMRIVAEYPMYPIQQHTVVQVQHGENSGGTQYNNGLDRLKGYSYIFKNKKLTRHIPCRLKYHMYAYCYLRMCEYYTATERHSLVFLSSLKAMIYAPFDGNFKIKLAYFIYNFPVLGIIFQKFYRSLK